MKNLPKLPVTSVELTKVQEFNNHLSIGKANLQHDIHQHRWNTLISYLQRINASLGYEVQVKTKIDKESEERLYCFELYEDGEFDVLGSFEVWEDRDYFLQCLEDRYNLDLETYLVELYGLEWSREENQYVEKI